MNSATLENYFLKKAVEPFSNVAMNLALSDKVFFLCPLDKKLHVLNFWAGCVRKYEYTQVLIIRVLE